MSGEIERRERRDAAQCPCSNGPGWHSYGDHDRQRGTVPAHPLARKAGELDPEWVMVGVDVPAGKRLYASRDLKGSAFAVALDEHFNGDGWHLTSTLCHMLVITRPTYGECMAEALRIWQNWADEGRELAAGRGSSHRGIGR
jgi:hypothetical protein